MTAKQNINAGSMTHGQWATADMLIILGMIALANTHLIGMGGAISRSLVFYPYEVLSGQWWRVLTYPFVHLSWYHLALDAGAFILLYRELEDRRTWVKLFYVLCCGLASLGVALFFSQSTISSGLTGLSGIAHGLMAVTALEMVRKEEHSRMGLVMFGTVVLKSIYEAFTGEVVFEFMYMGLCGTPLAACHAGGVLGGVLAFAFMNRHMKKGVTHLA
ncbi:MAG: rhombosortase [Thermodesulfovibrionales bacterium]|nr:rhombosortase [Thermodesulfovibrionales bacterium]